MFLLEGSQAAMERVFADRAERPQYLLGFAVFAARNIIRGVFSRIPHNEEGEFHPRSAIPEESPPQVMDWLLDDLGDLAIGVARASPQFLFGSSSHRASFSSSDGKEVFETVQFAILEEIVLVLDHEDYVLMRFRVCATYPDVNSSA